MLESEEPKAYLGMGRSLERDLRLFCSSGCVFRAGHTGFAALPLHEAARFVTSEDYRCATCGGEIGAERDLVAV